MNNLCGFLTSSHFAFQETELLDLSLVKDARCGKHAKAPKVGNRACARTSCSSDSLSVSRYQLIAPVKSFSVVAVVKHNSQCALLTSSFIKKWK